MNFYDATLPVIDRALSQLDHVLDKGAAYAAERKIEESVLLSMRLYPDMFPLSRQVQIACDMAKGCASRLAGVEIPKHEDHEKSFAELKARIKLVRDYLASFKPEQINASEGKNVTIKLRGEEQQLPATVYALRFVLPNVFFHCTTAYNLLRHAGAPVGKSDFIGPVA